MHPILESRLWRLRKNSDAGFWLVFLPSVIGVILHDSLQSFQSKEAGAFLVCWLASLASCAALLLAVLWPEHQRLEQAVRVAIAIGSLFALLHYNYDLWYWVLLCLCQWLLTAIACYVPTHIPRSFSLGELLYLVQLITFFMYNVLLDLKRSTLYYVGLTDQYTSLDSVFVTSKVIGLCALILVSSVQLFEPLRSPGVFAIYVILYVGLFIQTVLHAALIKHPVWWLLQFLMESHTRLQLLLFWLVLVATAVASALLVPVKTDSNQSDVSLRRKWFHVLIVAVYISGFAFDARFLLLASAVAFAVMVVAEIVRLWEIAPLSEPITAVYSGFLDSQDEGTLVTSHIYLLLGCSLPLWFDAHSGQELTTATYSGVIALGVGDGFAAVVGSLFGRTRWPASKKTLEGTGASVLSQMMCLYILQYIGLISLPGSYRLLRVTSVSLFLSLAETFMTQVDNVALPPVAYILYSGLLVT